MIDRYFEVHPRVREYLDETVANAKEAGYAVTMFGRKRHIPELRAGNAMQRGFGERTAMNHPMQGSAADIIKLAMNEVCAAWRQTAFRRSSCCRCTTNWTLACHAKSLWRFLLWWKRS